MLNRLYLLPYSLYKHYDVVNKKKVKNPLLKKLV